MRAPAKYYLLALFLLLIVSGCKRPTKLSGPVEAEYIEYEVNYLENMAGDIPTRMLPNEMESYYTSRFVMTSIEGFFGSFSLIQIADLKLNRVTTMLNFFGSKVFYIGDKGELPAGIVELDRPNMDLTDDTVRITGLLAHRAVISTNQDTFDIFFTRDIEIKSPNIATPYRFIDYVLSDFRVQLSKLKMRLIMTRHEQTTVDASIFEVPEDYEQVSKETMESIINNLFTKD